MATRPNILIILTDSTQCRHLGCYGDAHSVTPNLDRMAAEGICFRHAHATTPLCHPSRSAMLTGLYPHLNGAFGNNHVSPDAPRMNAALPTYYGLLHDAGYRCGMVTQSAQPNGAPNKQGIDDLIAGYARYKSERQANGKIPDPLGTPGIPKEGMVLDSIDDLRDYQYFQYGLEILDEYQRRDEPWVCTFEFDAPHTPCLPPRNYWEAIPPETISLPASLHDTLDDRDPRYLETRERLGFAAWSDERWLGALRLYRGVISVIDDMVGRLLERVDDKNTLVIFSSDHGDIFGYHGFWTDTLTMDETVTHIPLVMRWPGGIQPGQVQEAFVNATDWLPTLCEVAGATPPSLQHGRSLVPFFHGEKPADWRSGVVTTFYGSGANWYPVRAYRDDRYKYVFEPRGMDEFYDLQRDPYERHNLIQDPQYHSLAQQYAVTLAREMRKLGDSLADLVPIDGDFT